MPLAKRSKVDKIKLIISHFYETRNNHTSEDQPGGDDNLSTSSSEKDESKFEDICH